MYYFVANLRSCVVPKYYCLMKVIVSALMIVLFISNARCQEVDSVRLVSIKHVPAEKKPNKVRSGGIVAISGVAAMGLGIASMHSQSVNDPNRSSYYLGYLATLYGGVAMVTGGCMMLSAWYNKHHPRNAISVYGTHNQLGLAYKF